MSDLGGRPPYFKTPEELDDKIADYWQSIAFTKDPPTITGLALFLGFESRQSFYDAEKREGFSYTIKRARLRIEMNYEQLLTTARNATGAIFALKNFGWVDEQSYYLNDARKAVAELFPDELKQGLGDDSNNENENSKPEFNTPLQLPT